MSQTRRIIEAAIAAASPEQLHQMTTVVPEKLAEALSKLEQLLSTGQLPAAWELIKEGDIKILYDEGAIFLHALQNTPNPRLVGLRLELMLKLRGDLADLKQRQDAIMQAKRGVPRSALQLS